MSSRAERGSVSSRFKEKLPFRKRTPQERVGVPITPPVERANLAPYFTDIQIHFENEDVAEMNEGMWFPLSNVLADMYVKGPSLCSKDIYPVMRTMIDALPRDEMGIRSSTLVYKMLQASNVDRRATVSTAIQTGLASVLERFSHTDSAKALASLQYFSDFDFFTPVVDGEHFATHSDQVVKKLARKYRTQAIAKEDEDSTTVIPTNRRVGLDEAVKKQIHIESQTGVVAKNIPYQQLMVKTEDGKRLGIVCWTPADHSDIPGVEDDRLDPDYAISWDWAAKGSVVRELPESVIEKMRITEEFREMVNTPGFKRITNAQGIFTPEEYIQAENDIWFHVSQESLQVLGRPMEMGRKFGDLSAVSQFRLALRATLKGALAEENLLLTPEGRAELASSNPTPALSREAQLAFWVMQPEAFRSEYETLSSLEKHEFKKEVMQSMMMGLFYPSKFLLYAHETRIFEFFPQLSSITNFEWDQVMVNLPPHETYTKRQHAATHFTDVRGFDSIDTLIQHQRRFNSLTDPYYEFFQALLKVAPNKVPNTDNAYDALDTLLHMEKEEFEPMGYEQGRKYIKTGRNEVFGFDMDALLTDEATTDAEFNKEIGDAAKWMKTALVMGAITTLTSLAVADLFMAKAFVIAEGVAGAFYYLAKHIRSVNRIDGLLAKELKKHMDSIRLTEEEVNHDERPRG